MYRVEPMRHIEPSLIQLSPLWRAPSRVARLSLRARIVWGPRESGGLRQRMVGAALMFGVAIAPAMDPAPLLCALGGATKA